MSQEELAEAAGVTRSYVGNFERDQSSPSISTLLTFIRAIEKSYHQSFGEEENIRLAIFFLGPSREGTLIVAKEAIPLSGRRR